MYRNGKRAARKFYSQVEKPGVVDVDLDDSRAPMDQLQDLLDSDEPGAKRQMLVGPDDM